MFALVGVATIAALMLPVGTAETTTSAPSACDTPGAPCYGNCGNPSCGAANGGDCDCESCPALECRNGDCGGSCSSPTCGAKVGKACGCR